METAPLDPPYVLAVAGESLHWMEWSVVLPRLAEALEPGALLDRVEAVACRVSHEGRRRRRRIRGNGLAGRPEYTEQDDCQAVTTGHGFSFRV